MRIALIADTHLPRGRRRLPEACVAELSGSDLILHAGDVATAATLDELAALGPPLRAVCGNVDSDELKRRLPESLVVDADGARIAMLHDAGAARGRLRRLRARFPDADAVVFGHSHIPLHEGDADFQIFNPGSPTERRRQPLYTMGVAHARDGRVEFELVALEP